MVDLLARRPPFVDAARRFVLRYPTVLLLLAVAGLVAEIVAVRPTVPPHYVDFQVYRLGVQAWLHGNDMYGHLPPTSAGDSLPFIYPPFAAILLLPLAVVPYRYVATGGVDLLSFASLTTTLYLVTRRAWPSAPARTTWTLTVLGLIAAFQLEPVQQNFAFGQINLFLLALVALDCLTERPRWPRGLLLGIAAAVKFTPAAFLLFFLLRKNFRASATAVASALGGTLLAFVVAPTESWRFWFGGMSSLAGVSGVPYFSNLSLKAALARFGSVGYQPGDVSVPQPLITAAWVVLALLVVAAAALIMWWQRDSGPALPLLVNAAAALLVSPTSWSHHWIWVAPGLLILALHAARSRQIGWLLVAVALGIVFHLGPQHDVPGGADRELHWTPWQHLVGDAYVELTLLLLAVGAVLALRAWRRGDLRPTAQPDPVRDEPATVSAGT